MSAGHQHDHESKTRFVVFITAITMVVEIVYGYWTNSMALLADGYHMSSHVFALGLSWIAYIVARKAEQRNRFTIGREKILALSGLISAVALLAIAVIMAVQSSVRFFHPLQIRFGEAILVAFIGLLVNAVSAVTLHHDKEHSDHNIRAAYLHVLADALTSITAIIALTAGMFFRFFWLDALSGIISSVVITKWSVELIIHSGRDLMGSRKKTQQ